MRLYDQLNGKDKWKLFCMWIMTLAAATLLDLFYEKRIDFIVISAFLLSLFFLTFMLLLLNEYTLEEKQQDVHGTITKMVVIYGLFLAICSAGVFLPVKIHFLLAAAALLCVVAPIHYGLFLSLMIGITIAIHIPTDVNTVIYYVFLCMLGSMCSMGFKKPSLHIHMSVIVFALSVSMYMIGCYLVDGTIQELKMILGCAEGLSNVLLIKLLLSKALYVPQEKDVTGYGRALEDDFPLVKFVKSLPNDQYTHSSHVANYCYECAKYVGLDENLACCAGFYYSLCDNDEAEPIDYAVMLGRQNVLPINVVRILSQYQGIKNPITTKEAALVDLIDLTYAKYRSELGKGEINGIQVDVMIMTKFNELSSSGRYDESGLSMNMFLKIRDQLVAEVKKDDHHSNQ